LRFFSGIEIARFSVFNWRPSPVAGAAGAGATTGSGGGRGSGTSASGGIGFAGQLRQSSGSKPGKPSRRDFACQNL
jgi:hypothetical protein